MHLPIRFRVEIEAKIQSGYFSDKAQVIDIAQVKGRNWDDLHQYSIWLLFGFFF
jgi:hypothetical protein